MQRTVLSFVLFALAVHGVGSASVQPPVAVSPGRAHGIAQVESPCPTFSWGTTASSISYELGLYRVEEGGAEPELLLTRALPGTASSWTPELSQCVPRGGRYAWSIRAIGRDGASDWSPPSLFQVASGPSEAEFAEALAVVRQYLATQSPEPELGQEQSQEQEKLTLEAATEDSESEGEPAGRSPQSPVGAKTELSVDGGVEAVSFTGDGSGLANVHAVDLTCSGCVGLDDIANDGVDNSKLAANSVRAAQIATDAVRTLEIQADAVTASEIATGAVGTLEIAAAAVKASDLEAIDVVAVECSGTCGNVTLGQICDASSSAVGGRPIAVHCASQVAIDETVPCGTAACDDELPLDRSVGLNQYCLDVGGGDAIVYCIDDD